jgi:4-amino-4-deoxy-L-arabinose transferase-like glycosyltransferase
VTATATRPAPPARAGLVRRALDAMWGSWPRRTLVLSVVVGFVLRLLWVRYAHRAPVGLHDPFFYLDYGRRLSEGGGYRLLDGEPTAYYPIGYPAILAVWFWLVQHTPFADHWVVAAEVLNLILGTATVALVGVLGRRLVGPWVGAISAAIVALFPSLIFHTATILTETTFNFVFVLALVVLCWSPWRARSPSWPRVIAFGLLLGLAIEIRPIALLVVPMVFIALWWRADDHRASLRRFGAVVGLIVAVMIPWTVRNQVVMHAFLPIGTTTGDNLCIGNHPGAEGHFAFPQWCFGHDPKVKRPAFETIRNTELTHRSLEWIRHNLSKEPKLIVQRTQWELRGDHDAIPAVQSYGFDPFIPVETAVRLSDIADRYFFAVLVVGAIGVPLALRRRDPRLLLLLLSIVAVIISVWPFFGDARFHIPINVLVPIPAALALVTGARFVRRRTTARLPA